MLWKGRRESSNVIDQRSFGAGKMSAGALILGAIVYFVMGGNPLVFLAQNVGSVGQQAPVSAEDQDRKSFASVVLADTEDVWTSAFQNASAKYRVPKLVLFRGAVQSACGRGSVASGPFYCPADEKIYLDPSASSTIFSKNLAQAATSPQPTSSRTKSVITLKLYWVLRRAVAVTIKLRSKPNCKRKSFRIHSHTVLQLSVWQPSKADSREESCRLV